jgi:hypothetical protein
LKFHRVTLYLKDLFSLYPPKKAIFRGYRFILKFAQI